MSPENHDDLLNDEMFDLPEDPDAEKVFAELDATEGEIVEGELTDTHAALEAALIAAETPSEELHILEMHLTEVEGQPRHVVDQVLTEQETMMGQDEMREAA